MLNVKFYLISWIPHIEPGFILFLLFSNLHHSSFIISYIPGYSKNSLQMFITHPEMIFYRVINFYSTFVLIEDFLIFVYVRSYLRHEANPNILHVVHYRAHPVRYLFRIFPF